jgi:hypothetical protein
LNSVLFPTLGQPINATDSLLQGREAGFGSAAALAAFLLGDAVIHRKTVLLPILTNTLYSESPTGRHTLAEDAAYFAIARIAPKETVCRTTGPWMAYFLLQHSAQEAFKAF